MHSLAFPSGLSASLAAQLTPAPVPLLCVILVLPFFLPAAFCPARVLVFLFQCAVSCGASGCHQGSCYRREQLPFSSLCPHIPPLLCHSSLDACHTLHVSQLNECKLHQTVWEKQFSLRKMTEMGLWKKAQAHARHHRGKKKSPFWQISLRVLFPWGPSWWWCCCKRYGYLELLLQIQSQHVTRTSKRKNWKCWHLPEPVFCGFCVYSLPKTLFWPDLFLW